MQRMLLHLRLYSNPMHVTRAQLLLSPLHRQTATVATIWSMILSFSRAWTSTDVITAVHDHARPDRDRLGLAEIVCCDGIVLARTSNLVCVLLDWAGTSSLWWSNR
jgi:hypothetical protein